MTIEEIIKEAFSQGWNSSHECATDFDYDYALKNCLSEMDSEVKKLNIPAVIKSLPDSDEIRMKARELDEKDFAQWMWELQKGNVL